MCVALERAEPDCAQDDVTTLKQLQEIDTLDLHRRFPALLRRACEKKALQCAVALSHSSSFYPFQLFSAALVKQLDRETLKVLIEQGELHLDSWFEVEDKWVSGEWGEPWNGWQDDSDDNDSVGEIYGRLKYWKPLLILFIDAHNFECAEFLLEAGARTDVCEWASEWLAGGDSEGGAQKYDSYLQLSHRRHWQITLFCPGKTPLHSLLLSVRGSPGALSLTEDEWYAQKFRLLQRIVAVASKSNTQCLEWQSSIPVAGLQTEMCSLSLACFLLQVEAVVELLAAREAALGREEGARLIAFAMTPGPTYTFGRSHRETQERCIAVLKALAEGGADLSASSALYEACMVNAESVFDFLLETGVSPKRVGEICSPVALAVCMQYRRWSMAEKLLSRGTDPNEAHACGGVTGSRVLAVEAYLVASARLLLYERETELQMKVLEGLARAKADFKSPIRDGKYTPLSFAIEFRLTEEAEFLLRHGVSMGARPDLLEGRLRESHASPWLNNIICTPSCQGPELEKILRSLPASVVNSPTKVFKTCFCTEVLESPLGAALAAQYSGGLKALIEAGANVNVATRTRRVQRDPTKPYAPLLLAFETRQWEAAKILVQGGADTKCVREMWLESEGETDTPACLQDCPATLLSLIRPVLTASAPSESG
uniref:Uncharacterized protein n=1 Tax=Chromera velia CCMP2878 TaxID=1169474 RepID=A0A0G4FEH4_9ALVE|eukprot:Cvel_16518.t1-p1 / transcript=Cvel_16518.t1 / gene=Cvel_16518 / organism=Chromera_velia_CCMP2878 / gene_product=hypothetical protein / transcript_product=hypothetical protein / location=Cvel_scaffold1274:34618-41050(-) / protein_length=656 / sequence_SO=supercontig / SO=protein_coding / is_pseudo=false